jgi:transposase-like protein
MSLLYMGKHKTEDYKISAVQYYLQNKTSFKKTCRIFKCYVKSLKRWIQRYQAENSIKRHNRPSIALKATSKQIDYALQTLRKNEQLSMSELTKRIKNSDPTFNITSQHLGQIIRDKNRTRKRTRRVHFPATKYGKVIDKETELKKFYNTISKYSLDKIICLDETSVQPSMIPEYSRCYLGKRCIVKTDKNIVFQKFTLLVAINNKKCVGYHLYEKGGMTKERLVEFLKEHIYDKYKNHLIVLDNAGSHNNNMVKESIKNNNNDYLFTIPYTPATNAVEMYFNQLKHYLKLHRKTLNFRQLSEEVSKAVKMIKTKHYKNYFDYAYVKRDKTYNRNISTRSHPKKKYK